jgi:hypothetical protein
MATTWSNSLQSIVPSISTRGGRTKQPMRKTRWSVVQGDLTPPYLVDLTFASIDGLVHSFGRVMEGNAWDSCCRLQYAGITHIEAEAPTCLACVLCRGCHACRKDHICEATMFMGKWETKDGRKLYPFEMDSTHLMNAIKKLKRDEDHFKDSWQSWVKALEAEARLRKLL